MRTVRIAIGLVLVCSLVQGGEPAEQAEVLDRLESKASEIEADLIDIRRRIHMHPETSGNEEKTAALVAERLKRLGLEVRTGVGGHGVVGLLQGAKPGPVVAYRADMDAVPSQIVGDPPYKSRVPGVKHVCGHDAHVAVGLGVAEVLASVRSELPGSVKLIFQPAEENVQGARAMIADGALEDPAPQAIFALHTTPFEVGTIVCPLDAGLTGWDGFEITIRAESDLPGIASEAAERLGQLSTVEPITGPEDFKALMQGMLLEDGPYSDFIFLQISGPIARGIRGDRQVIRGQIRAAGDASYARAREQIEQVLQTVAKDRARYELKFADERFPDMHSDADLVRAAMVPIEAAIGEGKALTMHGSAPFFGEDFALFQQHVPAALFFLGVANEEKGIAALNHFPDYDIDESALRVGTVAMANVLLDYLRRAVEEE
jgi:metal-dependent amidase/aminoacylase/carboxypeptidase family protein